MKNYTKLSVSVALVMALAAALSIAENSYALPGPAPTGTAIAEYDSDTGIIVVSVNHISNWWVNSLSGSLTGPPTNLPAAGGIVGNSVFNIGEWVPGGDFTYTNIDLGAVASTVPGASDLSIKYNGVGQTAPIEEGVLTCIGSSCGGSTPGDFDEDGDVDGADFILWQTNTSVGNLSDWQSNFGDMAAVASFSAVPEPTSLLMVLLGGLALAAARRRKD
jgi:PEP-CTERM motif-containing protein